MHNQEGYSQCCNSVTICQLELSEIYKPIRLVKEAQGTQEMSLFVFASCSENSTFLMLLIGREKWVIFTAPTCTTAIITSNLVH